MRIDRKGWLVLGLCLLLAVSLVCNAVQALHQRSFNGDVLNALRADVDSALASLDAAVYMNNSSADWSDPAFRMDFYRDLSLAEEASAASGQLSRLTSGDPAAVAGDLGKLAAHLDATYLPAARRLAAGQATDADKASLAGFCDDLRQAGWPLRAQLRSQGWGKLGRSLGSLLGVLGPLPQSAPVITVPVMPYEEPSGNGGQAGGETQPGTGGSTAPAPGGQPAGGQNARPPA
jgi:hypothetical protein